MRMEAQAAALAFLQDHFPDCLAALLAGSVVRGEATPTSDLDIVIFTEQDNAPYRESFEAYGWLIEAFIYTPSTYGDFFAGDVKRRRPSLPFMCAEGLVLKDTSGLAQEVKEEAWVLLEKGPPPLSQKERDRTRYALTNLLDDFIGSRSYHEALFIAPELINVTADFLLDEHDMWRGLGKWNLRRLRELDAELCEVFVAALETFYKQEDRTLLVEFIEEVLERHGGRLFSGYSAGKE